MTESELGKYLKADYSVRPVYGPANNYTGSGVVYEDLTKRIFARSHKMPDLNNLLSRIGQERFQSGIDVPIPFTNALVKQFQDPDLEHAFFPYFNSGIRPLSITERMEIFEKLTTPPNYDKFIQNLRYYMDDTHKAVHRVTASDMIKRLGIDSGLLVDLGCGTGEQTQLMYRSTHLGTVGIDRQYYAKAYQPNWSMNDPNLQFVRADFSKGIPLASDTASVAVMDNVISYISESALIPTLSELRRVLKDDEGLLIVSPDPESITPTWGVFKNTESGYEDLTGQY